MVLSSSAAGVKLAARKGVVSPRSDLLQPAAEEYLRTCLSVPSPHGLIPVDHGLVLDGPLQGKFCVVPDAGKSGLFRPRVCVLGYQGAECHYRVQMHTNSSGVPYFLWRFANLSTPVIPGSRRRGLRSERGNRPNTTQPFSADPLNFSEQPGPVRMVCVSAPTCKRDYVVEGDTPFAEAGLRDWVSQHFRLTGHRTFERCPATHITVLSNSG